MIKQEFQLNHYEICSGRCMPLLPADARERNEEGADIYFTPNNFRGWGRRKKEDLAEITSFFCEIDHGTKAEQIATLRKKLPPSCVIETKRGLHVYWYLSRFIDCSDDPVGRADWFRDITANRICPALGADTQAADACRLLRLPMYRYWKDGEGTFFIDVAFETGRRYLVEEILAAFPPTERQRLTPEPATREKTRRSSTIAGTDGFWAKANALDALDALRRLSGTAHVSGERFDFRKSRDGSTRIVVNGKARNCWIDRDGKIGSLEGGGPSIVNWLNYYHKDMSKVAEILKEVWPELEGRNA